MARRKRRAPSRRPASGAKRLERDIKRAVRTITRPVRRALK